jgi:hypothetical protein
LLKADSFLAILSQERSFEKKNLPDAHDCLGRTDIAIAAHEILLVLSPKVEFESALEVV